MRAWPIILVAGPSWLSPALLCGTVAAALCQIVGFWPGSIGHDYHLTLLEAASWRFDGHQPPTAAIATSILTFGTASFTAMFVVKVLAHFGALALIVTARKAPALVKVGAFMLFVSPIMFALAPLLRNSTLEITFVTLAVALGVTGSSKLRGGAALASLAVATMFAPVIHFGHAGLVVLYWLWAEPGMTLLAALRRSIVPVILLFAPATAANLLTGNADRGSSIYVSALNSLGGMHASGEQTCVPKSVARGGKSPTQVFDEHYQFGRIVMTIWADPVAGFKRPENTTPEERLAVRNCWIATAMGDPAGFVGERLRMALLTIGGSSFEPHYVWLKSGDDYVLNPEFGSSIPFSERDMPPLAKAIDQYGRLGETAKMGSFVPYLGLFVLASVLVWLIRPNRRAITLTSAVAVLGFMAPQLLFAQDGVFRYYSVAAMLAALLTLIFIWLVLDGPAVTLRGWLARKASSPPRAA